MSDLRTRGDLARVIDHTLLQPEATRAAIERLCAEAREHGFATVCVRPAWAELAAVLLAGSASRVCTVVGFPTGLDPTAAKVSEIQAAVRAGAHELDVVIRLDAVKRRDWKLVQDDLRAVVEAAGGRPVKAILETAALTREEKIAAAALAQAAGAAFVKTSTGYGPGGATVEDVALLRAVVGAGVGVKASGGVRTEADARRMLEAGANRLGTSAGVAIVAGPAASREERS